jgi:hypothetical protein
MKGLCVTNGVNDDKRKIIPFRAYSLVKFQTYI